MESSSDDEDDFPLREWITPQSRINSVYQSNAEKGIRKLCTELLDLKDAVDNLCGNMQSKYLAFLRISEEVIEMEHELIELRKHISAQGILVQDLMNGVCRELDGWIQASDAESNDVDKDPRVKFQDLLASEMEDNEIKVLEMIDIFLTEHSMDEALLILDQEENQFSELKAMGDNSASEFSAYTSALLKRKAMLSEQLIVIAEQPSIRFTELRKALSGLNKLGRGPSAHQLLLQAFRARLQKKIDAFLPSCSIYPETYSATLSQFVFSEISIVSKESLSIFGDDPAYTSKVLKWAERELESFVHLVKENAPSAETVSAIRAASICVQASLSHCSMLESQGLKFSKLLIVLLFPYVEEVLEMNVRRARKMVLDLAEDDAVAMSPQFDLSYTAADESSAMITSSGLKFMLIVRDIVDQFTPVAISRFGGAILNRLSQLFDKYVDILIKALPGPSEDENLPEQKGVMHFRAETDAQQLALLGTAFSIADELLPVAIFRICNAQSANKEGGSGIENIFANNNAELKDWRRHLQHSFDKLRDHFCRQYVLEFIYSREGKARLDARMYLNGKTEDLYWDADPLPSPPFQALFAKLQQLAADAGEVLIGKEKIIKILLARVTETVVMWLSDEQDFWSVFEDNSAPPKPFGLQQLILDMHFTIEIAKYRGYPSGHVRQIASAIIARAIRAFSAQGVDPQSALPEDEWFVAAARAAIHRLLPVTSASESSEVDEHIIIHDEISESEECTVTSPSATDSSESFASAKMDENEILSDGTDPDC